MWKNALIGKDIIVHSDESTDRRGRAVFIVLLKILPNSSSTPPKIVCAGVTELETVNAQKC